MKRLYVALILLFISTGAFAAITDLGFDPLDQSSGAKPLGMGSAYTGATGDPNTIFYNPASIARSKGITGTFSGMKNYSLGAVYETGIGNVGFGITAKSTDDLSVEAVKASYDTNIATVGYGFSFGQFSFGVCIKDLISQRLAVTGMPDRASNSNYDGDAGMLWVPLDYLSIGVMAHNVMGQSFTIGETTEAFPKTTRAGVVFSLMGTQGLMQNDIFGMKLSVDSENGTINNNPLQNSYFGIECSLYGSLFIRGGSDSIYAPDGNLTGSSVGLGYKFGYSEINAASCKNPITDSTLAYVSFTYSPPKFSIFQEPEKKTEPGKEPITITSPQDDLSTYDDNVPVEGVTDPGAEVTINGVGAYVDSQGKFRAMQSLLQGKNFIEIEVVSGGERKTYTRKVLRKAKVVIAEEAGVDQKLVDEVVNKEADLAKREEQIKKYKEKGIEVTSMEKAFNEEKQKVLARRKELEAEKAKISERKDKVENLATLGVIEVAPNKSFEVDAPIKRGEMITWLVKAAGLNVIHGASPAFIDVTPDSEYGPYIKAAYDAGYLKMPADKMFRPNDPVKEDEAQEFFKAFGIIQ
jgi:hypothetical protein